MLAKRKEGLAGIRNSTEKRGTLAYAAAAATAVARGGLVKGVEVKHAR